MYRKEQHICVNYSLQTEETRYVMNMSLEDGAYIQGVPLATEPGFSLIILPLLRILERNLKRTYLIV